MKIKCKLEEKRLIFVINSPSIGAFLLNNGNLFVSDRIILMSDFNENEIALFLSTEISSLLMDQFGIRAYEIIKEKYYKNEINNSKESIYKREDLNYVNKFLLFYPECKYTNYYEDVEILKLSLRLLAKANFDITKVYN